MCEHSVVKLISGWYEQSTSGFVFGEMNPGNGIQRGIGGGKKDEGDEVKGHLLLMKYKAL